MLINKYLTPVTMKCNFIQLVYKEQVQDKLTIIHIDRGLISILILN